MPDFAVHFTFINKTSERLEKDPDGTSAILGHWVDLPETIQPQSKAVFQIADDLGLSGSEAKNAFFVKTDIDNKPRAQIHTYATCPFTHDNKSGSGDWQYNSVPASGHPLTVEYTVDYQSRLYRFKLVAESDHPLRNSRGDLVTGLHNLWDSETPSKWEDGRRGSYAPNVFAYESGSAVADRGHVDTTVRALDIELIGAEVIVYGSIDGQRVFQTDYFFIKSLNNIVVTAHVVDPTSSKNPFSKNVDVEWTMQLHRSMGVVQAAGPYTTRLELYWLGKTMHPAFWNGIPVGFLRSAFSEASTAHARVKRDDEDTEWYKHAALNVFRRYAKCYDTCSGASAFGMTVWGGVFAEEYYRAAALGSEQPGTLFRFVNCFDQAGMLELVCSLSLDIHLTSWLLQQPFGFIHETNLVGIMGDNDMLIVNNPFFGTDKRYALVDNNYSGRTWFHCHVYVGQKKPFDRQNDTIYDACAGPHAGSENAADYLNASRQDQNQTQLYAMHNINPGSVDSIAEGSGVTGVNGQPYQPGGLVAAQHASRAATALTKLVGPPPESFNIATTHVDWAHVDAWLPDVLGAGWSVPFKSVTVGEGSARAFWHLVRVDSNAAPIRVSVAVESVVAKDGILDMQLSTAAARQRSAEILLTTERDPEAIWERGARDQYGDYSYQYKPGLGAGRIVVVAANTVVDIAGDLNTVALEPTAHRLLERVVRRDVAVPRPPALHRGRTVRVCAPHEGDFRDLETSISQYDGDNHAVSVQHIGSRLALEFDVDGDVSVAGTSSPGGRVLLDSYAIESSREQTRVRFVLVLRELGTSTVKLHVADDRNMTSTTRLITFHTEDS